MVPVESIAGDKSLHEIPLDDVLNVRNIASHEQYDINWQTFTKTFLSGTVHAGSDMTGTIGRGSSLGHNGREESGFQDSEMIKRRPSLHSFDVSWEKLGSEVNFSPV